jgi:hypothetical protein
MAVAVGFEPTEGVNPHALSKSATDSSAPIVWGVPAGQSAEALLDDYRRPWANATRIAPEPLQLVAFFDLRQRAASAGPVAGHRGFRRSVGASSYCAGSAATPVAELVRVAEVRWVIEETLTANDHPARAFMLVNSGGSSGICTPAGLPMFAFEVCDPLFSRDYPACSHLSAGWRSPQRAPTIMGKSRKIAPRGPSAGAFTGRAARRSRRRERCWHSPVNNREDQAQLSQGPLCFGCVIGSNHLHAVRSDYNLLRFIQPLSSRAGTTPGGLCTDRGGSARRARRGPPGPRRTKGCR